MSGWTQLHVLASVLPWLGEMCINECAQVNAKGCMQQLKLYGAHQLHVTAGLGHGACLLLLASRQAVHTHNRDVAKTSIHSTTKQARVALCVTRIVHQVDCNIEFVWAKTPTPLPLQTCTISNTVGGVLGDLHLGSALFTTPHVAVAHLAVLVCAAAGGRHSGHSKALRRHQQPSKR